MRSLGLNNNPNILKYPFNEWFFRPEKNIVADKNSLGGIWVCRNLGDANKIRKYMQENYNEKTRIFLATIDQILFFNSYRIKTNGIKLFEEYTC